ncbi:DUF1835 domain-containing protein [Paraflavisolibacter sp. H34]|uniref:DUF1835 domain-containing protein n=1 Tax=Huijunlia imazamoxiresistens TaxID=3127457 RepID=UPI00301A0646
MIHIVFQEADIAVLEKAMELDAALQGKILQIKDDYAVGPLDQLSAPEGWQQRKAWWQELLLASPYGDTTSMVDDRLAVHQLKRELEESPKEVLWIWMGQNGHDVCGYYWLISQLKELAGRVFVLYMNNLPFLNEKGGIFYPTTLHEIPPSEYRKAKKLNRAVTASEFEIDPDEWNRLSRENAFVRILEGGKKIASKDASFYDAAILQGLSADWQKGGRAMGQILSKMKLKTGDVFLLWRLKALQSEGKVELNGDPSKGWKEFEVRLKTGRSEEAPAPEDAATA